jgi:hypothetical protein
MTEDILRYKKSLQCDQKLNLLKLFLALHSISIQSQSFQFKAKVWLKVNLLKAFFGSTCLMNKKSES